jgi:hypothetical protein
MVASMLGTAALFGIGMATQSPPSPQFGVVVAVISVAVAARAAASGIFVHRSGLTVRTIRRTWKARWADIAEIDYARAGGMRADTVYVGVRLKRGPVLKTMAITGREDQGYAAVAMGELKEWLAFYSALSERDER